MEDTQYLFKRATEAFDDEIAKPHALSAITTRATTTLSIGCTVTNMQCIDESSPEWVHTQINLYGDRIYVEPRSSIVADGGVRPICPFFSPPTVSDIEYFARLNAQDANRTIEHLSATALVRFASVQGLETPDAGLAHRIERAVQQLSDWHAPRLEGKYLILGSDKSLAAVRDVAQGMKFFDNLSVTEAVLPHLGNKIIIAGAGAVSELSAETPTPPTEGIYHHQRDGKLLLARGSTDRGSSGQVVGIDWYWLGGIGIPTAVTGTRFDPETDRSHRAIVLEDLA